MGSKCETIEQALRRIQISLAAAGVEDAARDARKLLAAALNASAAELIRDPSRTITPAQDARLTDYTRRRVAREPVSRILGEREFYGRTFTISPAVLDPRPDTETIIDAALAIARGKGWAQRPITILDIGTGSGAILLTLLAELPNATGLAIDISLDALDCAAANAAALGLADRARFARHDILAGLPVGFDLVVSNPPYITTPELASLDPEVAVYDPVLALDGGCDGLAFYRAILEAWAQSSHLSGKQQALVLELGAGQCGAVEEIARQAGALNELSTLATLQDLGNHTRCMTIQSLLAAK
ncbi:MAG: peptide chain release factor N(5)-glutamine methyltransferase [Hyphomicrobiaceae bacterium]